MHSDSRTRESLSLCVFVGGSRPIRLRTLGPVESGGELAWFRAELLRSILKPRAFARELVREHWGLEGVIAALLDAGLLLVSGLMLGAIVLRVLVGLGLNLRS